MTLLVLEVLVVPHGLDASAEDQEGRVDVPRLLLPLPDVHCDKGLGHGHRGIPEQKRHEVNSLNWKIKQQLPLIRSWNCHRRPELQKPYSSLCCLSWAYI